MGQVPAAKPPIAILGDGRAASHFAHYLGLSGIPCVQWSRRLERSGGPSLARVVAPSPVAAILVSDSAIEPLCREIRSNPALTGKKLVHFSGSLATPLATGLHPLMTFGAELYELETYQSMAFVADRGAGPIQGYFPGLENPSFEVEPSKKALYHSLCVLSGNFTVLLWRKFFQELEGTFGVPREAALPYLERTLRNVASSAERALTGPLQRGDRATIARNLEALAGDPYQGVYRSFVEAAGKESA